MWPSKNIVARVFVGTSLFFLLSCQPNKPIDRSSYEADMEAQQIKHITEGELIAAGEKMGLEIIDTVEQAFLETLKRSIVEKSVTGAIPSCQIATLPITRKLQDSLQVSIVRLSDKPANPDHLLTDEEQTIWEAYQYAPENAHAQIQQRNEEELVLTKPIVLSSVLCQNCHGTTGVTVTSANAEALQKRYPDNQAFGYSPGDLRGMWRVVIPRKTVVNHL